MGKMITVYLTDVEKEQIEKICQENGCNFHSVVKAGLHLLLDEVSKRGILKSEKPQSTSPKQQEKSKGKPNGLKDLLQLLGKD